MSHISGLGPTYGPQNYLGSTFPSPKDIQNAQSDLDDFMKIVGDHYFEIDDKLEAQLERDFSLIEQLNNSIDKTVIRRSDDPEMVFLNAYDTFKKFDIKTDPPATKEELLQALTELKTAVVHLPTI